MVRVPEGEMALMGSTNCQGPEKTLQEFLPPRIPVRQEPEVPATPSDELKTETPG